MRLIRGLKNLPKFPKGSAVTIGAFDGIHLGHQAIIRQVQEHAERLALPSVLICFEPLPREFFAPDDAPMRILSFHDKCRVLEKQGIDVVLCIRFNREVASLQAEDFFEQVFVRALNLRHLVVGDDFRFGSNREGDKQIFLEAASKYGFGFSEAEVVVHKGSRVSSTRIRECLVKGDFSQVSAMLGRPYSISGRVIAINSTDCQPYTNFCICCPRSTLQGTYIARISGQNSRPGYAVIDIPWEYAEPVRTGYLLTKVNFLDAPDLKSRQKVAIEFLHKIADVTEFASVNQVFETSRINLEKAREWVTGSQV